jgi:hypothetical protein
MRKNAMVFSLSTSDGTVIANPISGPMSASARDASSAVSGTGT